MLRLITLLLAGATFLAACGSDDIEPKEPKASAATVPKMPEQALEDGPEGAAAFVVYYVDLMTYAASSGDVQPLTDASTSDCLACSKYISSFAETYSEGGWIAGAKFDLSVPFQITGEDPQYAISGDFTVSELTYKDSRSSSKKSAPAETDTLSFGAVRTESGWRINQISLGAPE